MGLNLQERNETAIQVQDLLTEYGCFINTRLGVHKTSENSCSSQGLIILEFLDNADKHAFELEEKLNVIKNVVVKKMVF